MRIAPAVCRPVLALLETLDLAVGDVVQDVLERSVASRTRLGNSPSNDASLHLREQSVAVGIEPLEAVFGFPDRPVTGHGRGDITQFNPDLLWRR